MVANQKIIAAINEQIGNEFSAMLQYYAIAAYFDDADQRACFHGSRYNLRLPYYQNCPTELDLKFQICLASCR